MAELTTTPKKSDWDLIIEPGKATKRYWLDLWRFRELFLILSWRDISYYDFARHFAEENGYSPKLVKEDTWKVKLEFEPPKFTSMVNV